MLLRGWVACQRLARVLYLKVTATFVLHRFEKYCLKFYHCRYSFRVIVLSDQWIFRVMLLEICFLWVVAMKALHNIFVRVSFFV